MDRLASEERVATTIGVDLEQPVHFTLDDSIGAGLGY